MPANRTDVQLMCRLDPDDSRHLPDMCTALKPYFRYYHIFLEQHEPKFKAAVYAWDLDMYLDVLDTANVVTRIDNKKDELCGDLYFKCSCKMCFVRGCRRRSVIWSMVLNPGLILPPKYTKLEPGARKRRVRPTKKRVERLKQAKADDDARPFVDRAPPLVNHVSHSGTMNISELPFCTGRRSCAYVPWTGRIWSLPPPVPSPTPQEAGRGRGRGKSHCHKSLARPAPDIMHGSRLALPVLATTRRVVRPRSYRPLASSTSAPEGRVKRKATRTRVRQVHFCLICLNIRHLPNH
jgi:hypothetical protein